MIGPPAAHGDTVKYVKVVVAFVACVLVAEALAAAASTQFVLLELARLGVDVTLVERLDTTAHDIIGMLPLFGTVIGAGFLIAFPVAWFLSRHLPEWRAPLFAAAGFCAVTAAHVMMNQSLSITPVAGARSATGLLAQGLAGAIAGYVYTRLSPVTER